jgi:hypothetical protein
MTDQDHSAEVREEEREWLLVAWMGVTQSSEELFLRRGQLIGGGGGMAALPI